jgi:predicted CoA-binding protein
MPFSSQDVVAVVGASNNPDKYGCKVLAALQVAQWCVIPVNPKGGKILGVTAYPSILQVPQKIDGVVFVTKPEITEQVLFDVKQKGINDVWFQPGSESETAIQFCEENNIKYIKDACIMTEKLKNG